MRVLVADDHRLIIEGVKLKLADLGSDVDIIVAMTSHELEQAIEEHGASLDLALIDITMPGTHGYEHIAQLHQRMPELAIIVLTGSEDVGIMRELLELGIRGLIPKVYSPDVMLSAIRLVLAGGVYVPPMVLPSIADETAGASTGASAATTRMPRLDDLHRLLTERQIDVMRLLSQGKPNKSIARELGISEGTVKIHLAAIFRSLNVRNRVEAVVASRNLPGL